MKVGVLGTGEVGRAVAERVSGLGHDVLISSLHPAVTMARTEPSRKGTELFSTWIARHPEIRLVSYREASRGSELVVNAIPWAGLFDGLDQIDAEALEGKVLIDLSLPLDFSQGSPPRLHIVNDDSLGEQIQRRFTGVEVVKTLNTVEYRVMVDPSRIPGTHHLFLSGENAEAKAKVAGLLREFGWPAGSLIDLGGISTARAVEMYSRLLFTLAEVTGDFQFNIAVARSGV